MPPSIRVLHDDPDLIVVDKPPGLLTANTPGEKRAALFDFLKRFIRSSTPRRREKVVAGDDPRPRWASQGVYGIHRLDKEASGLLVFAKTEKAFTWLKQDFKTKRVHRVYTALVAGEVGPAGTMGTIQSFLREDPTGKVESISTDAYRGPGRAGLGAGGAASGPGAEPGHKSFDPTVPKLAVTHYRVIGAGNGFTLLQVRIDSGRKHQIRVHLSDRGHPIAGDWRYGSKSDPLVRLGLHASELGFTHPGNGQSVRFNSSAPASFYKVVGMEPPKRAETPAPALPHGRASEPVRPAAPSRESSRPDDTSWEGVANWYDAMQGDTAESASDHYRDVIVPGTLRLVQPQAGMRILDVACGQGLLSRAFSAQGAAVIGVDASPSLIDAAKARGQAERDGGPITYHVGDARELDRLNLAPTPADLYDVAVASMALGNIEPLEPVFRAVAKLLKPGGRFVAVISHPAFRAPGQTSWDWDDKSATQMRRVSGYLSTGTHPIQMHPGKAAAGAPGGEQVTWTFHRPLQHYVRLLGEAGLLIQAIEEWPSLRVSQPGPRATEENRARREIPLFLAWRAVRV